jgi:hypothetical protein
VRHSFVSLHSRPRTALAAAAVFVLIGSAVTFGRPVLTRALTAAGFAPAAAQAPGDEERGPDRVMLLLTSTGFEQEQMTVRPGAKLLRIDNASGAEGTFSVAAADGAERPTPPVRRGSRHEETVVFTPGTWVVTATSRPEWVCTINVEP